MKKLLFTLLALVMVMPLCAQVSEMKAFGFKGQVLNAKITSEGRSYGSYSFGADGYMSNKIYLWDGSDEKEYELIITDRTKKGFSGESNYGKVNATVTNNRITKLVITGERNNNKSTYTCTYSYDGKGNLTKVNEVYVYYVEEGVEYGSNVYGVDNYYNEIEAAANQYINDLTSNPFNAIGAANRASKRIGRAASGVGVSSYARVKKTKKTEKAEYRYSNYVFDEIGNWVSRTIQKDSKIFTQYQTIKYEPNYYSQYLWSRLEKEGNLNKIEEFYNDSETTEEYKNLASKYWNERILDEVTEKYGNDLDKLCLIASKAITSENVKEQALEIVRADIYNNVVLKEQDYAKVLQMRDLKRYEVGVFDIRYQKMISAYGNKLKTDSIIGLSNKAKQEFDGKDYQKAVATSKMILVIDPTNAKAADISQEASYQIVKLKEADKSVKELDYELFVENYPNSPHITEMQNNRALYASSLFNKSTSNEEINRVDGLPVDAKTSKTVEKRCKKWEFRINRGRFFHVGIGGDFALGGVNTVASGELLMRFGYTANVVNFVTGLKYNYLSGNRALFSKDEDVSGFEKQYFSVPVMLRFHTSRDYNACSYIGVGTDINISSLSSKLTGCETDKYGYITKVEIQDDEFANKKLSFTPTVAFGVRLFCLELELFANYDLENPFDVNYIKDYKLENGKSITSICNFNDYKKQIENDGFGAKFRGGLAVRIWF